MSSGVSISPLPAAAPAPPVVGPAPPRRWRGRVLGWLIFLAILAALGWAGWRAYSRFVRASQVTIPSVRVTRSDVSLSINAKGVLRGGTPEVLVAPMIGGTDMHLTFLRKTGEPIHAGDIVFAFDTTEQEYKLKEAEADVAEAEQKVLQARAQRDAQIEEDRYALLQAKTEVTLAGLEVRKNPLLPAITARQNQLALENARDHLAQLEQNLTNRQATNNAGIAIQEAGRAKAELQAKSAHDNIDALTIRAHRSGYVGVKENASGNFFFFGMTLPLYQVGDTVRPGMAVAEIPDMEKWEIAAKISELDRGHLAVGDPISIQIMAVPGRAYKGRVKELGGTTGPFWDRRFECNISLDDPSPELRPGMSAETVIETDRLRQVLSLPAQALFEQDGRTFVYAKQGGAFEAKDVKLVRRNETRVVIEGLQEGQLIALTNPADLARKKSPAPAAKGLPK